MNWTRVFGFVLLSAVCGCSIPDEFNRGGEISGKVTLDGKPVPGGQVFLASVGAKHTVSCEIGPEGEYRIAEPPLGECQIAIKTSHLKGMIAPPRVAEKKGGAAKAGGSAGMIFPKGVGLTYLAIPLSYENHASSGLKVTIARGKQAHDISLTGK